MTYDELVTKVLELEKRIKMLERPSDYCKECGKEESGYGPNDDLCSMCWWDERMSE